MLFIQTFVRVRFSLQTISDSEYVINFTVISLWRLIKKNWSFLFITWFLYILIFYLFLFHHLSRFLEKLARDSKSTGQRQREIQFNPRKALCFIFREKLMNMAMPNAWFFDSLSLTQELTIRRQLIRIRVRSYMCIKIHVYY